MEAPDTGWIAAFSSDTAQVLADAEFGTPSAVNVGRPPCARPCRVLRGVGFRPFEILDLEM